MRLLLDTHIFLWWASESSRLSPRVYALIRDSANTLLLSVVSVWEIQIKLHLNKLQLDSPLQQFIASQQQTNNITILPIRLTHVLALQVLPLFHKDPFDRMLIAQANSEGATLITVDRVFAQYPVATLG